MRKKDIYKKLEWMAKDLPDDEYEVWNGVGRQAVMTKHKVNHVNRLKALWNRTQNIDDLNNYFLQYGRELRSSESSKVRATKPHRVGKDHRSKRQKRISEHPERYKGLKGGEQGETPLSGAVLPQRPETI